VTSPLEQSIQKTLSYFDLANYPLTKEELFAFLWQPPAMGYYDFMNQLNAGAAGFETARGYYFLHGRENIIAERQRRLVNSEHKLKIAKKAAKKLRSVPFLRAIFVCNSVGSEQALQDSDIDFFIVTEAKRIWIARFFSNLILRFFGIRTYGKKIKDKICLSFFVDGAHLDLAGLRIAEDDVHFAYWIRQMLPLYDPENYYSKFLSANGWIKKFMPNLNNEFITPHRFNVKNSGPGLFWKKAWEKMWTGSYGDLIEVQAKGLQWARISHALKEKSGRDDKGVVFSEGVLKFHENDTRKNYREAWLKKCNGLPVENFKI